jgi:3-oxoacyl-[acyl-carrier protein] reductase
VWPRKVLRTFRGTELADLFCSLHGKVALVTGASRGIGRAIAVELASAGASVVVGYRSGGEEAEAVAAEIGGRAVQADVADVEDAKRLVEEAGDVDILVNNAGLTRDTLIARMSDDDWRSVIDTNLGGVFNTCRAVVRGMMRRRSGAIVNVSSIVGLRGNPGQANYSASKAGIIGFTKSLARELGSRGVRANVVAPGYVSTRLTDAIAEELQQQMLAATPLGRFGDPADIAAAVRFLCSDEASFITGEVLLVDGGLAM